MRDRLSFEVAAIESNANPILWDEHIAVGRHNPPLATSGNLQGGGDIGAQTSASGTSVDQGVYDLDGLRVGGSFRR